VKQELFRHGKVLHTNVDNLVERRVQREVNSAKFNTMIRIALLLCNERDSGYEREQISERSDEAHGVVGRKAQFFGWQED